MDHTKIKIVLRTIRLLSLKTNIIQRQNLCTQNTIPHNIKRKLKMKTGSLQSKRKTSNEFQLSWNKTNKQ